MVTFQITGLDEVINRINSIDLEQISFRVATQVRNDMFKRVFVDGKASDGSQIGTYTTGYMKVRTNDFKSKNTVRGANKGKPRFRYNHLNDPKVILTLTGQMNEDFGGTVPIKIENGHGIGFSNRKNYEKAMWQDDTKGKQRYNKPIWNLTKEEQEAAQAEVHNYLVDLGLV